MRALDRNKKVYDLLASFSTGNITDALLIGYNDTDSYYVLSFKKSGYIEGIEIPNQSTKYSITDKGWECLKEHEKYLETKKTNEYLLIFAIPAALYYAMEIGKFIYTIFANPTCH
jgi:hypothetical protein